MDLSAKLVLTIFSMALTFGSEVKSDMAVQAFAQGSDCRCKCILTTKDGGPCEETLLGGARKTIYLVETISGGSDCRCSCNTPRPSGCEVASQENENVHQVASENLGEIINLVELHSRISNMVSIMIKIEKAVLMTASNSQQRFLRQNVNKVVSGLKGTNGSYSDLLKDLGLATNNQTERIDASGTMEATTRGIPPVVPSLTAPVPTQGNIDENAIGQKQSGQYDRIGVVPIHPQVHSSTTAGATTLRSNQHADDAPTSTIVSAQSYSVQASTVAVTTSPERPPRTTRPMPTVTTSTSTTSSTSTTTHLPPFEPRILFIPYRAVSKSSKSDNTKKARNRNAEYEYDEFDLPIVTTNETTSTTPAAVQHTSRPTSPSVVLNSTTTLLSTTTERDDSYADHLSEFEYDYDYSENEEETTTSTTVPTTPPIDPCGTLFSISRPMVMSHFGRREGAWMRDPVPSKTDPSRSSKIYIANFYYGSNLIEFDGVEGVRNLRYRNFYNLPHKWSGTGHIVYNGSFYYNRAFSATLIKYNLQNRFVSAWSRLTNVMYNTRSPLTWRGHTGVHLAADEGGLWAIFPSQDPFDIHAKLTYIVNKINPVDLTVLESYKTKTRHPVSHAFMICGILYTTDRYNSRRARVSSAYDTRTLSQRPSYLGFENMFSYTVQFSYNPNEKKIYAWDNGRQVEYDVGLIH